MFFFCLCSSCSWICPMWLVDVSLLRLLLMLDIPSWRLLLCCSEGHSLSCSCLGLFIRTEAVSEAAVMFPQKCQHVAQVLTKTVTHTPSTRILKQEPSTDAPMPGPHHGNSHLQAGPGSAEGVFPQSHSKTNKGEVQKVLFNA